MGETKPTLKEVVEMIHKINYLRHSTIDVVLKAEYEERLNRLFELKKKIEKEQVQIIAKVKKRHLKDLQTAVLIAGKKLGLNRNCEILHKKPIEHVAN
jgi:hypothetical protein